MPFKPVEDIPDIDNLKLDFKKVTPKMYALIDSTRLALKQRYNFRRKLDYKDELAAFLRSQLLLFKTNHQSTHILIKYALRQKYPPPIVDAVSLSREQIEKVFSIALVINNPHKWIKQSLRAAWRGDYQAYLLQQEEHVGSARFDEFLNTHYPKFLKQAQHPPSASRRLKPEVCVSEFAKRALTYYWNNPGGKNPPWFKRKRRLRDYIAEYFEFPTPGKAIRYISSRDRRRFLVRWHKEYSYLSEYTHPGLKKTIIPFMNESKNLRVAEKVDINMDYLIGRAFFTSFIATTSACTLIIPELKDDYGAKRQLKEFWGIMNDSSLLSRSLWKIFAENQLK